MEQDREDIIDLYDEARTRARDVGMCFRNIGDQMYHERCHINQEHTRSTANNIYTSLIPHLGIIATNIYKACYIL